MTETSDSPATVGTENRRLHQALAWVGIVAGVVFTVVVIFFSGFALGHASGGYGWHRYPGGHSGCPMMQGGMMGSGGMMGPGGMKAPGGMMAPDGTKPTPGPAPSRP